MSPQRRIMDAEELHHYFDYCSELVSLIAKTAALCAERTSDPVVLNTVSEIETLGAQMSQKIWQKISLLPGALSVVRGQSGRGCRAIQHWRVLHHPTSDGFPG